MAKIPIPSDWDGVSWCCHIVEWPRSLEWGGILSGLLTQPLRGRFWDEATGIIVDAQAVGLDIEARNCLFMEGQMTCLDDLNSTLSALVAATYNSGGGCGCGGSNGAGITAAAAESFTDNGANWPDGYVDRADYDTGKCDLAEFVVSRLITDLNSLKVANVAGQSAAALASVLGLALLTPIPFDELLIGVAAGILGLVSIGLLAYITALNELITRIEAMDICELFDAQTVSEAVLNVEAWIDGGTYSQSTLTKLLGKALVGVDSLNPLFAPVESLPVSLDELPPGDCSACNVCTSTMIQGTGDPEAGGSFSAALVSGHYELGFWVSSVRDMALSVTGWTASGLTSANDFRVSSGRDAASCGDAIPWDLYNSDANPLPASFTCGRLFILSATDFTLTATYS